MLLISVIIPAYNEEPNLGLVLRDTKNILQNMGFPYEIIVVNDGSQDNTADIARKYGVILINNDKNLGKGAALINGFRRAKGNIVVTMDADGSHRAEDIPFLLSPMLNGGSLEAIVGSRFVDEKGRRSTSSFILLGTG